jgi:ATP-binding cassette, subfamily C (CFTR/MRP), member 1
MSRTPKSRASVPAAVVSLLDAFVIGVLSHFEHSRTIKPSSVLCIYLFLSCLFDGFQTRTLWIRYELQSIAPLFSAALGVKVVILLLEAKEKKRLLVRELEWLSPEATSGIYNRCLFWWLNSLFVRGFRGILSNDDLFTTDESLSSKRLHRSILRVWEKCKEPNPTRKCFAVTHKVIQTAAVVIGLSYLQQLQV